MSNQKWKRVSRQKHCPICDRGDWCLLAADGGAVICSRVESPKRCGEAGWLHRLTASPWIGQRVRVMQFVSGGQSNEMARLAKQYQEHADHVRLCQLSVSLGLSLTSLCRLRVGWSSEHRAWSFPMVDTGGDALGIRLRRPDGFKFAVKGGKEGLFVPENISVESSPLLITEGVTDVAALLDMGFGNVVGRPSCTGGIRLLVQMMQRSPVEVVIVADGDEPGRRGADNLASVLTVYSPAVRVITPPENRKDVRDWLRAGGTREDVDCAIEATAVRRLTVKGVRR